VFFPFPRPPWPPRHIKISHGPEPTGPNPVGSPSATTPSSPDLANHRKTGVHVRDIENRGHAVHDHLLAPTNRECRAANLGCRPALASGLTSAEAGGAARLGNESFFSAPQLKRDPLGRHGTQIVQVSPTRDRIGRVILAPLAGAAVVAGVVARSGAFSRRPTRCDSRWTRAVSHGLGLIRIARRGEESTAKSTSQRRESAPKHAPEAGGAPHLW